MQYKDMSRNNYYPIIFFNDFWLLKVSSAGSMTVLQKHEDAWRVADSCKKLCCRVCRPDASCADMHAMCCRTTLCP
jgi:hypothetical protein